MRDEWGFLALQSMIDHDSIPDVDETYEFRVGDSTFTIDVRDSEVDGTPEAIHRCTRMLGLAPRATTIRVTHYPNSP